ncbi:hypothetical protein [Streptomyces winkii]|uniref:hypothetical protein n=1 Tax=Streptomyces winkii TaxID=3051178 RepID=UPI0028D2CDE3|nr:hypothetical protein [Streptomyces sp. DSM 40971]
MNLSRSVRRGFFVAAAASGLLALGAGSASANEAPGDTAVGSSVDDVTSIAHGTGVTEVTDVTHRAQHGLEKAGSIAKNTRKTGDGARRDAGKAIRHVTQEAGQAVSQAPSAAANKDVGAVSRIPAQAAPSSTPGLPEDLVIEVPEVIPGVPSIGIIPSSIPALPVTPTVPII